MPYYTQEALEALTNLSTFFSENTLQTRRSLRSEIEKRSLSINEVCNHARIIISYTEVANYSRVELSERLQGGQRLV